MLRVAVALRQEDPQVDESLEADLFDSIQQLPLEDVFACLKSQMHRSSVYYQLFFKLIDRQSRLESQPQSAEKLAHLMVWLYEDADSCGGQSATMQASFEILAD